MEIIKMYVSTNPETRERVISYDPLPPTRCKEQHYLIADDGKILKNQNTGEITRAIIVQKWEVDQWTEQDI